MTRDPLLQLTPPRAPCDRTVERGAVGMPAPAVPRGIAPHQGRGEKELPRKLSLRRRAFMGDRRCDRRIARTARKVGAPPLSCLRRLAGQRLAQPLRQHHDSVFITLARADDNLRPAEVDIAHPQGAALRDAQSAPVEDFGHQTVRGGGRDFRQYALDLGDRKHGRHALRPAGALGGDAAK